MNALYTSNRRFYTTKEGELCEAGDPKAARLLVSAGGTLPHEEAKRLGLLEEAKPKATEAKRKLARRGGD